MAAPVEMGYFHNPGKSTRANHAKAWGAKERVLVRPTKGGMPREKGKADPHKIAALPKS